MRLLKRKRLLFRYQPVGGHRVQFPIRYHQLSLSLVTKPQLSVHRIFLSLDNTNRSHHFPRGQHSMVN